MTICMILVVSVIYTAISYEEVYDLTKIEKEVEGQQDTRFNEESFIKWK